MKCPVCGTPDLLMTERQGVEIDYCPSCRGVWLDRGELDKLIERTDGSGPRSAHAAPTAQLARGRDDDRHHDRREYHEHAERRVDDGHREMQHGNDDRRRHYDRTRKKKSLFEMFDFD